jgi:hypothetical protein
MITALNSTNFYRKGMFHLKIETHFGWPRVSSYSSFCYHPTRYYAKFKVTFLFYCYFLKDSKGSASNAAVLTSATSTRNASQFVSQMMILFTGREERNVRSMRGPGQPPG